MASSNRNWPSMFKSKPCNQPWHEITTPPTILSSACQKSPYTSAGCEERTPEPKPRWNPKPEQIRILEAIFNSGMINPPREEIHKIRLQLQQYGQVGDANVFYWFQNRKSRTKNKNRHLLSSRANTRASTGGINTSVIPITGISTPNIGILTNVNISGNSNSMTSPSTNVTVPMTMTMTTQTTSSSSSERSSGSSKPLKLLHVPMSAPEPVNMYNNIPCSTELSNLPEPFFFPNPQGHYFSIPELTGLITAPADQVSSVGLGLWNEPMGNGGAATGTDQYHQVGVKRKNNITDELHRRFGLTDDQLVNDHEAYKGDFTRENNGGDNVKIGLYHDCCFQPTDPVVVASSASESVVTAAIPAATGAPDATCATTTVVFCPVNVMQDNSSGGGEGMGQYLTVFINERAYEVPISPLNVKSVFGANAVLVHSSGYPVPTDEFYNTLQPLQHGALYYVVLV